MKSIYLDKLENLKEELESLKETEMMNIVDENDTVKYVIVPSKAIEDAKMMIDSFDGEGPHTEVKIIGPDNAPKLSFEEYEVIKKEILKSLDETFKPKPEKLN